MLKSDSVVKSKAYLYRYSTKSYKLDVFDSALIIRREFPSAVEHMAYYPGNTIGIHVDEKEKTVTYRNGIFFYFWSTKPVESKEVNALFLNAIETYFTARIEKHEFQVNRAKAILEESKNQLKQE